MIALDEQALVCDLAEVYHIFDYRSLPVQLVATLSSGLRDDSRIKMKLNGEKVSREVLLLAGVCDRLTMLMGALCNCKKLPKLITEAIYEEETVHNGFESPDAFLEEWDKITNGGT